MSSVVAEVHGVTGEQPNVDFGLTALAWTLNLPTGAPLALFALGRTVGWIGHAIEQYEIDQLIRPRARYVGRIPNEQPQAAALSKVIERFKPGWRFKMISGSRERLLP